MTLLTLISTAIMITGSAYAEPVWVKTPFWQTVYEKSQIVKLKSDDLTQVCDEYSSLVYAGPGRSNLSAEEVGILRTNTSQIHDRQFSSTFTVDRTASEYQFAQSLRYLEDEVSTAATRDVLPHYTARPMTIFPLEEISTPIQTVFSYDSLSRVSQALGLAPLKIEVTSYVPEIKIRVYGRDSACDLFRGKAQLSATSKGTVKISLDHQLRLNEFYQGFEELTERSFKRTSKPLMQMAFLGYNLAPLLAPLQLPPEAAANLVETLVADFFSADGHRNENWTVFDEIPHLSVSGSSPARFQLKMER